MTQRKRGRPTLPESRRRSASLGSIRVTEAEFRSIWEHLHRHDLLYSEWAREELLGSVRRAKRRADRADRARS